MRPVGQPENPEIVVAERNGEVTLFIDGHQAMQAWERDLMVKPADLLREYGNEFLEVGLGLGISALRIAQHPNAATHRVWEKYQTVIGLFLDSHPQLRPRCGSSAPTFSRRPRR